MSQQESPESNQTPGGLQPASAPTNLPFPAEGQLMVISQKSHNSLTVKSCIAENYLALCLYINRFSAWDLFSITNAERCKNAIVRFWLGPHVPHFSVINVWTWMRKLSYMYEIGIYVGSSIQLKLRWLLGPGEDLIERAKCFSTLSCSSNALHKTHQTETSLISET